eukprot:1680872-Amphidinium_carterae.1
MATAAVPRIPFGRRPNGEKKTWMEHHIQSLRVARSTWVQRKGHPVQTWVRRHALLHGHPMSPYSVNVAGHADGMPFFSSTSALGIWLQTKTARA